MSSELPYTILVVADSSFNSSCTDPGEYVQRLKKVLTDRVGERLVLKTIDSKYGMLNTDPAMDHFKIEDKNKTSFVQTVENVSGFIDELLVISVINNDPFLDGLCESLGRNKNKKVTRYNYVRK